MTHAILYREYKEKQTEGVIEVWEDGKRIFKCYALELPWLNNQNNISCIPEGQYFLVYRFSPKYQHHLHILNLDGTEIAPRSYCLIHPANYVSQLRGCIATGSIKADINGDGQIDVGASRKALDKLRGVLPVKTLFFIVDKEKTNKI